MQVFDDSVEVERLECFRVVEALVIGVGQGGILMQGSQVELVRPPALVRRAASHLQAGAFVHDRALGCIGVLSHRDTPRIESSKLGRRMFLHLQSLVK